MPVKPKTHKPHRKIQTGRPRQRAGQFSHIYTTPRWRKLRAQFLLHNPLCIMCENEGKITAANIVDHIEPHRGDIDRFWSGPFQALCKRCHDSKKQALEKSGRKIRTIGKDGYPVA